MDISYQGYVNKVVPMTLTANYKQQLQFIQSSPKFAHGKPQEFPGFTIITPLAEEDKFNGEMNDYLSQLLETITAELDSNFFAPVPPETFHLTVADLIWDKVYISAVKQNSNFDQLLITEINRIFNESQEVVADINSLDLEVMGISIFPRAIAVCFIPTEKSYEILMRLRQLIYQDEQIINLGIEQQYDFVGHVTLGYFEDIPENLDIDQVESIMTKINNQWISNDLPLFKIKQWELRKFTDMITYFREADWAQIKLS